MVLLIFSNPDFFRAVITSFDFGSNEIVEGSNFEGRIVTPLLYLEYFFDDTMNLFVGTGFASTKTYLMLTVGAWSKNLGGTHNQYVEVLLELGVGGFVVFLWMLLGFCRAIIYSTIGNYYQRIVFVTGFLAILVYAMPGAFLFVGSAYGNYTLYFFVVFAICLLRHLPLPCVPSTSLENQTFPSPL